MKRSRTFVLVLLVSVIGVAVLHAFLTREPTADGRALSSWLRFGDYDESNPELIAATNAIRKIGVKAIPVLLEKLQAVDPLWKSKLAEFSPYVPFYEPTFHWADQDRYDAWFAFSVLGNDAASAIPELSKMLLDTNLVHEAAVALGLIGRGALPVLKAALKNANPDVRIEAITGLTVLESVFRDARPELQRMLSDTNEDVAATAIYRMNRVMTSEESVVLATEALCDPRPLVAGRALSVLKANASSNSPAVPKIVLLLQSPVNQVREQASNTLRSIDPTIAFAHGVDTNESLMLRCGGFRRHRTY